jgi:hypothetical protein
VEPSLDILVILACFGGFPVDTSALRPPPRLIVGEGVRGIVPGGESLAGHGSGRRSADVVDVQLVFLMLLGVLADEATAFGRRLKIVAH